jgi:hypothetical protein
MHVAVVAAGVVVPVVVVGAAEVVGVVAQTPDEEHSKPAEESQAPAKLEAELSPQGAFSASLYDMQYLSYAAWPDGFSSEAIQK